MNPIVEMLNRDVYCTLAPSGIHGLGVFAIRDIPKGYPLFRGQYDNEICKVIEEDFMEILEPIRNIILDRNLQENTVIWFTHPNNDARLQSFMNHAKEPNSNGHVALVDIKCGEEVTENYKLIAKGLQPISLNRMNDFI